MAITSAVVFRSLKFTDGGGAGEGRQIEPGRGEAGDGHGGDDMSDEGRCESAGSEE